MVYIMESSAFRLPPPDSAQLKELWILIQHPNNGIMFHTHRYRLRAYNNCIVGSELVDWLLRKDKVFHRDQAVAIGQALLDAMWLESVTGSELFRDEYALYKPGETASVHDSSLEVSLTAEGEIVPVEDYMEPMWFREIQSEDKGNLTDDDGLAKLDRSESDGKVTRTSSGTDSLADPSIPRDRQSTVSSEKGSYETLQKDPVPWDDIAGTLTESFPGGVLPFVSMGPAQPIGHNTIIRGWVDQENLNPSNGEQEAFDRLHLATYRQLEGILEQQLDAEGLDLSWGETIMSLANRICTIVKPEVRHGDDMDIRQYVHIKKVPGGHKGDCYLVHGAICTKHVAHKKMTRNLSNPKVLLLQAAVEHQRVENKFSSLDPIILQEHEYLKNCVAKMVALSPNILVVEKTVARLAQDLLLANDITVVLNVKPSVMERISRCTEGSLISSIDQVTQATLGKCLSFHQHRYELPNGFTKTLMFFDGCPAHLGCSIMLRGGTMHELRKVKKILQFMIYASYNTRLELSFLMDECALPPVVSDPSNEMQTPSGASITTPLTASESISEGLALMQSDNKDTQDDEKQQKGAKTGIKDKMRQKLFGTKAAVKGQGKASSVDETDGKCEDFVVLGEAEAESGSLDSEEVISQELAEAMTDTDKPSMTVSPQVERDETDSVENSPSEEVAPHVAGSNVAYDESAKNGQDQDINTKQSEAHSIKGNPRVSDQQSDLDFDHEATAKKLVSHLDPNMDDKSADSVSIASFEDVAGGVGGQGGSEKGANSFSDALNLVTLSVSPFIKYTIPYTETSTGKASKLKKYLSPELFWSARFSSQTHSKKHSSSDGDALDEDIKSVDRLFTAG
ncbi:1-phosphatidylinositol 3-phosphate 5-kinase-like [Amphiura filiformis]|uniref:1-phosphatidylinositol 3-phosphate 5-kinase-like n=1 Tax=Amphiura filiformis TaxID=82378 RepID=UPI003B20B800